MKLIENKRDIIRDKVYYEIYWKVDTVRKSNWDIRYNQCISVFTSVTSNILLTNIYNEIRR